jgi:hypothetical protein
LSLLHGSLHGYWRVRIGAQARALEGQCYAVQSPTVGKATWSPAVDINRAAAVYGPPDRGMPVDGVLAIGSENAPAGSSPRLIRRAWRTCARTAAC